MIKFIDYSKDYLRFKKDYDAAWERVNLAGDLILRKDVEEFEGRLAEYVGTKYAVALNSGTDAIYLSLKALGITGRVALPSHTFKATCGAVINAGATPVLYDLNGDIESTNNLQAEIPVHIAGELSIVPNHNTDRAVIEDACQALGALKNPTSDVQCWSFYPAKLLGAKGDAGAITTNYEHIYEYVKEARNHFKNDNRDFGINSRMDNIQAALLNIKIQHIDEILARREEIAMMYFNNLHPTMLPNRQKGRTWQDFIIRVEERDELYDFLKEKGIETMKNEYPFSPEYPKLPIAAKYEAETLRIPCNENLTDEEVQEVIEAINEFYDMH